MLAEVKNLFWLQWRLTLSMFRTRRLHVWARLGRILLMLLMLLLVLPMFMALGAGLGWGLTQLSPQAGFELLLIANTVLLFFWLLLPATYNSQFIERFEMSRLFVQPIRFRSLVVGSTLVSLLGFAAVWTLPMLAGEVVGLTWKTPWTLPIVLLGALPTFAILVLTGRLMDDVLDLVASDRRLRGLLIFLMTLPFILLLFGNYYIQYVTQDPERIQALLRSLGGNMPPLETLSFGQAVDMILVNMRLSRFLLWLPPGWATAGMALAATGRWLAGLGFLALSLAWSGGMLWAHGALTRRLMQGTALHIGTEQVHTRRWEVGLPGPPAFWGLFRKDWNYLRRSPTTLRALLTTPIVAVAFGVSMWQLAGILPEDSPLRQAIPFLAAALVLVSANLGTSNLIGNYFGAVDREGFVSLMLTPVDRRYVLLSANLLALIFALAQSLVLLILVGALTGNWLVLPWGLLFALCLHLATAPLYTLASILTPYRAPMQAWGSNNGNIGTFLAWMVGTPIPMALFILPIFLWKPGQLITLPLAMAYGGGLFALTLGPLARLVDRRSHQ
ncbi:MAG: hypothetical protein P8129_17885, partial [Anaerolineae bacterium]